MYKALFLLMSILFLNTSVAQFNSPDEVYGNLFTAVQTSGIFSDYKTFPDCTPKYSPKKILALYEQQRQKPDFKLKSFVLSNFYLPDSSHVNYKTDTTIHINRHIDSLWNVLTLTPAKSAPNTSLIALPYPYIVPGGRFREMFYWDSYFIMLGLEASGRNDLLTSMMANFNHLIDTLGYIPNGNRTYFLSRSQPPFYAMMVDMMAKKDSSLLTKYLPYLEREYEFWMNGSNNIKNNYSAYKRVVRLQDGELLNSYWDDDPKPRPEAYGKDIEQSKNMDAETATNLYRSIRAACESGWDFSTRWNKVEGSISTIYTTAIVPVDLNCLMYFLEQTIARAYLQKGMKKYADKYATLAAKRKIAITKYCWSEKYAFFMDYDFKMKESTPCYSLAGAFPLYFNLATNDQATKVADKLAKDFLKDGGFVTTLVKSNYQWDSPNGWAPLQWITVKGLQNYGKNELANSGASKWLDLNEKIFKNTGKLLEKYNVEDKNELTGGGEYDLQDGFGWTNGVYLKLKQMLK